MKRKASLNDLYLKAAKLSGAARESFLGELTDSDREYVENLLLADQSVAESEFPETSILQQPNLESGSFDTQVADDLQRDTSRLGGAPTYTQILDPDAPQSIGPYQILQTLGKGGMGQVYLAEQHQPIKRQVALKIIRTDTPTDEILARFEAERQALAMMDHQNIAKVLDAGMTDQRLPFFAMELIKGVPITDYCDVHQLQPIERLELFVQTCRAIEHAHQKGVIHRDIKPSNILVTQQDDKPIVKVIDFGLAKAVQEQTKLTSRTLSTNPGQVVGTLAYMSPEQAEFNSNDIDTRTDVYSLGVVLYELLTGSTPISRDHLRSAAFDRILKEIREDAPPRPSTRLSQSGDAIAAISQRRRTQPRRLSVMLKGDLDWIVMLALEKDRNRRYGGVAALADDIERYLRNEPIHARPPSFPYRFKKTYRKHRAAVLAAMMVVLSLVLGLVGTAAMWYRAEAETDRATIAKQDALAAKAAVEVERDRAKDAENAARQAERIAIEQRLQKEERLARTNYLVSVARWNDGRASEAIGFLNLVPERYRNLEWYLARRQFRGSDITAYGHTDKIEHVAFSPNQQQVASASSDSTISIWDAQTGTRLQTLSGHTDAVLAVAYSPNGLTIASTSADKTIRIWDLGSGETSITLEGHSAAVTTLFFSPDGQQIVSGSEDHSAIVWDIESGKKLRTLVGHKHHVLSVAVSPDGLRIATASRDQTVKLWKADSGRELRTIDGHARAVTSVLFNPNGSTLASASEDNNVKIWNVDSGDPSETLTGHTQGVTSLAYSPDGLTLASGGFDRIIRLSDTRTGKELAALTGHTDSVYGLSFSSDGMRLASGSHDRAVKLWDVRTGAEHATLRGHEDEVITLSLHETTGVLASGSKDKTVKVWDAQTGRLLQTLHGHKKWVRSVDISPDGQRLASADRDRVIKVWDLRSGSEIATLSGHADEVTSVTFSPDGKRIASASGDQTVRLWDAASGEFIKSFNGHEAKVLSVDFNSDGAKLVSSGEDNSIRIWNVDSGELDKILQGHQKPVRSVAFAPDDAWLVSGSDDQTIRIWDAASGHQIRSIDGNAYAVQQVVITSSGSRIVSASQDNVVKIWDAQTGEELRSLRGRRTSAWQIPLTVAGNRMVTTGHSNTIDVMHAPTIDEVKRLRGHKHSVVNASITADGTQVFSEDSKGERFVWDVARAEVVANGWPEGDLDVASSTADGRWQVAISGKDVLIIDSQFKDDTSERAYRAFKATPDPIWHRQQAAAAEQAGDLFAATVHWSWAIKTDPESVEARIGQQIVYAQLLENDPDQLAFLPEIARETLALPRLVFDQAFAAAVNETVLGRLMHSTKSPPMIAVHQMSQVCDRFPQGNYLTTLGIAQYRAAEFEQAIKTLGKSIKLNQADLKLDQPHPIDLAFLAMSHFRLGNLLEAKDFLRQLKTELKRDEYQDEPVVTRIAREAAELFTGSSAI